MLLEAQHSAWLTSVFSTRLQVASRPCWSQHTPPVDKGGSDYHTRGALLCHSQHPAPSPGGCIQLVLSNYRADDVLPTWEGGAETCTGAPIPAQLWILLPSFWDSSSSRSYNPHSWWEALPTFPHSRPPGPGLASCPTSQTPRAGHVRVSGPWSRLSASALCLDSARGHTEPPSPGSPPLPGPPLTHSNLGTFPLHELTISLGTRPSGRGLSSPLRAGLGWGCRVG